jgi:hypothetical protein
VVALGPTIVHALDALEKTFSKKNVGTTASNETIAEHRNKTLKFVRSNYSIFLDYFKYDVVSSDLINQKYFKKEFFITEMQQYTPTVVGID